MLILYFGELKKRLQCYYHWGITTTHPPQPPLSTTTTNGKMKVGRLLHNIFWSRIWLIPERCRLKKRANEQAIECGIKSWRWRAQRGAKWLSNIISHPHKSLSAQSVSELQRVIFMLNRSKQNPKFHVKIYTKQFNIGSQNAKITKTIPLKWVLWLISNEYVAVCTSLNVEMDKTFPRNVFHQMQYLLLYLQNSVNISVAERKPRAFSLLSTYLHQNE